MKRKVWILFVIIFSSSLLAQWHLKGSVFTSVYNWEAESGKSLDWYPGFQFKLFNAKSSSFHLKGFIRGIYTDETSDFSEKIYNLNLNARPFNDVNVSLGRIFLFDGVINGTLDGVAVKYTGESNFHLNVYAGMHAPSELNADINTWNDDRLIGFSIGGNLLEGHFMQFSSVQKWFAGNKSLHLDGVLLSGRISHQLFYFVDLQYNHLQQEILRQITRLSYYPENWNLILEYTHQLPMIYEYSYFTRFKTSAYDQFRINIGRRISQFMVNAGYVFTRFDDEQSSELNFSIGKDRNSLGILYYTGFSGDNFGVFGQIYQPLTHSIAARLYANYYSYQRYKIDISEEAVSYSAGLEYKSKPFLIRMDVQQAINNLYKKDVRLLFHVIYRFAI